MPGAGEVRRVVTGVTAQRALVERAVAADAQLVLVHHGLFWSFDPPGLTPLLAERLRPLFKHDIGLAAYHLPLDAHPEVGNNALLAEALGRRRARRVRRTSGAARRSPSRCPAAELFARVAAVTGREPLVFDAGPAAVRRLAIVSRRRRGPARAGASPRATTRSSPASRRST